MQSSILHMIAIVPSLIFFTACPQKGTPVEESPLSEETSTEATGAVPAKLEYCTRSGQTDCLTTQAFPARSLTSENEAITRLTSENLGELLSSNKTFEFWDASRTRHEFTGSNVLSSDNIKSGVTLFGVSGSITASSLICAYSSQAVCEANSICQWTQNSCSIDPWHIRIGKSLAGVVGKLKTSCRNRANSTLFNYGPSTLDWWDTIEDSNNRSSFPSSLIADWTSDTDCDRTNWRDLTADGACDSAVDDCLIQDRITGLTYSESYPHPGVAPGNSDNILDWYQAISHCFWLEYGGFSDWRLPTQKEMQEAYVHGILDVGYKGTGTIRGTGSLDNNSAFLADAIGQLGTVYQIGFWTSTSSSSSDGILIDFKQGYTTGGYFKYNSAQVLCVRP